MSQRTEMPMEALMIQPVSRTTSIKTCVHGRLIDEVLPAEALGETLKQLRRLRNEMDYSPYPGPDAWTRYDDGEPESLVVDSVERAERVVTMLAAYVEGRERTS